MESPTCGIVILPPEILILILEHTTDRSTILSLCRSCSTLRLEGEAYLYASIDARSIPRHIQFLSTIAANPRLASLVRSYRNLYFDYCYDRRESSLPLKQALQAMTKLKHLDLTYFRGSREKMELLKQCRFQLKSFTWGSRNPGGDWASMVSFLRQQHSLEHLVVTAVQSEFGRCLPPDACQKLSSFSGPLDAMEAILPGRNITTLNWTSGIYDDFMPYGQGLPECFNRLRFLSIGGRFSGGRFPRPHLRRIVEHLRSLEVLELPSLKPDELSMLPKLPRLSNIIILSGEAVGHAAVEIEYWTGVVNRIFASCAVMKRVDVGYPLYVCWIDNVQQDNLMLEGKRQAWWKHVY